MADNHVDRFKKHKELLFNLFEKSSSKFRDLHYIAIFYKLLLFIIVFYFFKINHAATWSTAIIACTSYLLCDIFLSPEVVDKCEALLNKLFTSVKSKSLQRELKLKEELDKMKEQNDDLLREIKSLSIHKEELTNLLLKSSDEEEEKEENYDVYNKDGVDVNDILTGVEDLKSMKEYTWENHRFETERAIEKEEKCDRLMSDLLSHLKNVEEEKKLVSHLEEKCANLTKDIESERIVYKTWKEQEKINRKKLEDEKDRLEQLVVGLRKTLDTVLQDKDRNLNYLKKATEDMSNQIQFQIENEFVEVKEMIENANSESEQESEDESDDDDQWADEVDEKLNGLKEQLDNLVKDNQELRSYVIRSVAKETQKNFQGFKEWLQIELDDGKGELLDKLDDLVKQDDFGKDKEEIKGVAKQVEESFQGLKDETKLMEETKSKSLVDVDAVTSSSSSSDSSDDDVSYEIVE